MQSRYPSIIANRFEWSELEEHDWEEFDTDEQIAQMFYWENKETLPDMNMSTDFCNLLRAVPPDVARTIVEKTDVRSILGLCIEKPHWIKKIQALKIPSGGYEVDLARGNLWMAGKDFRWEICRDRTERLVDKTLFALEIMQSMYPGEIVELTVGKLALHEFTDFESLAAVKHLEYAKGHPDNTKRRFTLGVLSEKKRIRRILDHLPNLNEISVSNAVFRDNRIYTVDHAKVSYESPAQWYHLERMANKTLELQHQSFCESNINRFLMDWLIGSYDQLEMLRVSTDREWNKDLLLANLDAEKYGSGDFIFRPQIYFPPGVIPKLDNVQVLPSFCHTWRENGVDLNDAYDIERSDGKIASILIQEKQILIIVWEDPSAFTKFVRKFKKRLKKVKRKIQALQRDGVDEKDDDPVEQGEESPMSVLKSFKLECEQLIEMYRDFE